MSDFIDIATKDILSVYGLPNGSTLDTIKDEFGWVRLMVGLWLALASIPHCE